MAIIQLGSDTLAGTATAGQVEYNGTIQTFTPLGTQRGVIPNEQFFALNSGLAGANVATAQSIFGVGVTLSSSTIYEFEAMLALSKSAGTTSHTVAIGFGGTATLNNIAYQAFWYDGAALSGTSGQASRENFISVATATILTGAITTAAYYTQASIKGIVSINAGGTFTPQYTLSAAPGGDYTTAAGSYIKIKPIGASGANVSVGTWA